MQDLKPIRDPNQAPTPCRHSQRGVTLIELMVIITIVAILVALAVNSFQRLIADNTLSTQANSLLSDTRLARSEATKRGIHVTLCPSADPDATAPTCDGTDWKTGWIVFVDNDADNRRDPGEDILRRQERFNGSYAITGVGGTDVASWRFDAEGRLTGTPNSLMFSTTVGTARMRYLCVTTAGRVRLAPREATSC